MPRPAKQQQPLPRVTSRLWEIKSSTTDKVLRLLENQLVLIPVLDLLYFGSPLIMGLVMFWLEFVCSEF